MGGILKFLPLPKKNYVGATNNNTGGRTFENYGDWEKFKYEGAYKISWGVEKIERARLSAGLLQRGVYITENYSQDLNAYVLESQLAHFREMFQDENCSCFKDIYAKLQELDPAELNLISKVKSCQVVTC